MEASHGIAPTESFGMLLRRLRRAASLSQEELAERAEMSVQAVSALERGQRRHPYPRTIRALSEALGASREELAALLASATAPEPAATGQDRPTRSPTPRPAQLPADLGDFTGRAAEVARIVDILSGAEQGSPRVCAISGKAGVGKSALAVHVAHRLRERFPDAQLHVELRGEDTRPRDSGEVLRALLRSLGVEPAAVPQDPEERARLYRSLLDGRRCLVVLDDARHERQVLRVLPGSPTCAVVVTSRRPLAALPGAELFELADLDPADAIELLARVAGEARMRRDPAAAREIVELCGRLPLAIRVAGAVLRSRPHWPASKLLRRLADERRRLDELQVGDLDVRGTFAVCYRGLAEPDARVFRLLGTIPAAGFSAELVAAVATAGVDDAEDALDRLGQAQLLHVAEDGRWGLHSLVRLFCRERLGAEERPEEQTAALDRALAWYLRTARDAAAGLRGPTGDPVHLHGGLEERTRIALAAFEAEWSGLVDAAERAAGLARWDLALELADALWPFFVIQSHWSEVERTCRLALRAAGEVGDRSAESRFHHHLGTLFNDQRAWESSGSAFSASLRLARELDDGPATAHALHGLAKVHRVQGRLEEARRCQEDAVAIFRRHRDRHGEGLALNGLGVVLANQGLQETAEACLEGAVRLLREAGDPHSEGFALINLGDHLRCAGRLNEAVSRYERHLAICEELHDRDCAVWSTCGLADVRRRQGRLEEAVELSERVATETREHGDHGARAQALLIAGDVRLAQGQHEEAVARYEAVLALNRERGERQYECWTLNRLAEARADQGRLAEAEAAFELSLAIARELRAPHEEAVILRRLDDVRRRRGLFAWPA